MFHYELLPRVSWECILDPRVEGTSNFTWNEWGIVQRACDLELKLEKQRCQGYGRIWNYKIQVAKVGTGWR